MTLLQVINCTITLGLLIMVGAGLVWVAMHSEKAQDESDIGILDERNFRAITNNLAISDYGLDRKLKHHLVKKMSYCKKDVLPWLGQ